MRLSEIPRETGAMLQEYRFDAEVFESLREKLRAGGMGAEENRLTGSLQPPAREAWDLTLPAPGTPHHDRLAMRGREAIAKGQVGVVVLNGGMATRFGGVVKCAVPVLDGRSFLDLKLSDIRNESGGKAPAYLMNSFATHLRTRALLRELGLEEGVETFTQGVMLRVRPDGAIFLGSDGLPSPNAPGHGDLTDALRASGVLRAFLDGGGKILVMCNVDNLGATLDPSVIGAHLEMNGEMTVELVNKVGGDKGGAPAVVDGRLQIVEEFRFPRDFDQDSIPVFNTNTFVFNAEVLDRDFPLTWFAVRKKVEGSEVVQFERLAGELTSFLRSRYLLVPRDGAGGRFLPVKDPDELERRRGVIELVLKSRKVLP